MTMVLNPQDRQDKKGFSIVEIIMVVAMFVIFFSAIHELLVFSSRSLSGSARKVEAMYLAQEGIEAVRSLRNKSWSNNIATLNEETTYYLELIGDTWTLSLVDPGVINGRYTRTVVLSAVYRDTNDDISDAGTEDLNTKKVRVELAWPERGGSRNLALETYLTNFLSN